MHIEVFKTNITEETIANGILKQLMAYLPESVINFDLEDCDRILRIENCNIESAKIVQILVNHGYYCEVMK